MDKYIENYIDALAKGMLDLDFSEFEEVVSVLDEARQRKGVIYICGNGGSASTASHFMNDLNKLASSGYSVPFKSVALTDNIPLITAWGNDESYDQVFVSQLENFLTSKDVVVGISGSGNSANVVNAISYSNEVGATTVALLGFDGGELAKIVDYGIHFTERHYGRVEDAHMISVHIIANCLKDK